MKALWRGLTVMLGLYLAMSLGRTAAGLAEERERNLCLLEELHRAETALTLRRDDAAMTDEEVRAWAFRHRGLVAPEDVVFCDEGAWDPED